MKQARETLQWQLLSTFSTSKLQAKSRVRVTCRLVDKMFVTTMMEFVFQKFLLMNLGARKPIPGKESSWLILLHAPPSPTWLGRQRPPGSWKDSGLLTTTTNKGSKAQVPLPGSWEDVIGEAGD